MDPDARAAWSLKSYPPAMSIRKSRIRRPNPAVGINGVLASCIFLKAPSLNERSSDKIGLLGAEAQDLTVQAGSECIVLRNVHICSQR